MHPLRLWLSAVLVFLLSGALLPAQQKPAARSAQPTAATQVIKPKYFPYTIHYKKLANGLDVIVIPAPEFKDMVTFATPVFAGSRQETEKGKTGLAHLFEHIMFRHEFGGQSGGYDEHIRRMGAHNNAFTSFDITFYHPTTFTSNLVGPIKRPGGDVAGLIELEADRFKNLKVDEKTFRTEAGAVLGEYRRNFANPGLNILEKTSEAAFPNHPYGHTVIGTYEDVKNMPEASKAAWDFFRNYYTPNNSALVVVGDVQPAHIFAQVDKHYADWKPAPTPKIPVSAPAPVKQRVHVPWEADVSPRVTVSYYTPAIQPGTKETGVTLILNELLTSRSAPLFQKLRYQKQSVTSLNSFGTEFASDPHLLMLTAELMLDRFRKDGEPYVQDVEKDITTGIEDLQNFSQQPNAAKTLDVIKSKLRNDLLAGLDSTDSIATQFSVFYRFNRNPRAIDMMLDDVNSLTPADIDAYARKYFTTERKIVTTFWGPGGPAKSAEVR